MPRPALAQDLIEQIKGASVTESCEALAKRLGVSVPTVKKYRRQDRQERQEIAREIVTRHVEANIPDALADLTALREMARRNYEASEDSRQGQLWLAAIKTTLEHVRPDDSDLDRAIESELEAVAEAGPRAAAAATTRTAGGAPAYH